MAPKSSTVEQVLARLASKAHGVVTRRELLDAGLSSDEIKHRLENGSLLRQYRGVYRVGHTAPSLEARYLAAVRACGDGAVLSGKAAAFLYELIRGTAPRPEVTTGSQRCVPGVATRRSKAIETATHRGIPVTTVARTLVDLAPALGADDLARACHEAGIKYGTAPAHVKAATTRIGPKLRRILDGETHVTLSKLEKRFLELMREEGLPLPVTNREAGGRRVDCRWPDHRLTVELDGYRYHRSRHAWEQDRRRER